MSHTAGLVYSGEAGALNEGLSDFWGACLESYVGLGKNPWTNAEEAGPAMRNFQNPNSGDQPDTYEGTNWANVNSSSDHGGVHTNSGVFNHWFYVLSQGENGTNDNGSSYTVNGIGINDVAKIVYRAEKNSSHYFQ